MSIGPQLVLVDAPMTDRDWQSMAWERLAEWRARHMDWTLDDALRHELLAPIVRAYGRHLQAEHARKVREEERAQRYGRRGSVWVSPVGRP